MEEEGEERTNAQKRMQECKEIEIEIEKKLKKKGREKKKKKIWINQLKYTVKRQD